MLRPLSLLLLRLGTGLLLMLWGGLRLMMPEAGPGLADKYYGGLASASAVQTAFAALEVVLGILVCVGLWRRIAYPAQAVLLILATVMIGKYLLDPLGMWLMDKGSAQILFFPSITLAAASLALVAFRAEDSWSLDVRLSRRG